jgi:hypothetical protein
LIARLQRRRNGLEVGGTHRVGAETKKSPSFQVKALGIPGQGKLGVSELTRYSQDLG